MRSTIEDLVALETVPLYQCHKKVRALKIARILGLYGGNVYIRIEDHPAEGEHLQLEILAQGRPTPQAGWYYVVYEDGYESFTPPEAFEAGYTRIETVAEFHVHDVPATLPEHSGSVLRVVPKEGE